MANNFRFAKVIKTAMAVGVLSLAAACSHAEVLYENEALKQRVEAQQPKTAPGEQSATYDYYVPAEELMPLNNKVLTEDEDAFGRIMHTALPQFISTSARIEKDGPESIEFELVITFIYPENEDDISKLVIATATVYTSADSGLTWAEAIMSPAGDRDGFSQKWRAAIPRGSITGTGPVIYYFSATDRFGNVATELPRSSPGWPPSAGAFFSAAGSEDNSEDIVPAAIDILDTWVARDGENIYVATKLDGNFSAGSTSPYSANMYVNKFMVPGKNWQEGLMQGKGIVTAPYSTSYPELIDFNAALSGHDSNFCIRDRTPADASGFAAGHVLFTSVPLKSLCPKGCKAFSLSTFTGYNMSADSFYPIPVNSTSYTVIYLTTHVLDGGKQAEAEEITVLSAPEGNKPLTDVKPAPIEPAKGVARCPKGEDYTAFTMFDGFKDIAEAFDFKPEHVIEAVLITGAAVLIKGISK